MEAGTALALLVGLLGLLYRQVDKQEAERIRQADKSEAERNRQAASRKEVTRSWQQLVQPAQGRLQEYKQEAGADGIGYARKFMADLAAATPGDTSVNQDRRLVRVFWQDLAGQFRNNELPSDFFDSSSWMHWADQYRRVVEPLDIGNYYQRDLPSENQPERRHYRDHRPSSYRLIEEVWVGKHGAVQEDALQTADALAAEWDACHGESSA